MGKGKLAKFADMETYENVFQYPYSVVEHVPFEMKGHWHEQYFKNNHPIQKMRYRRSGSPSAIRR